MKQIGHIKTFSLDLTAPLKLKVEKMELNAICILVGQNGTGKTLVLKLNWIMSTIINGFILNRSVNYLPMAQSLFDNSFDDNDFTGSIISEYKNSSVSITIDKGKIKNIDFIVDEEVDTPTPAYFMSKETRLFSDIIRYMKTKKMMGITGGIDKFTEQNVKDLCTLFKMYDITLIESMLYKLGSHYTIPDKLQLSLDSIFEFRLSIESLDITDTDIIYNTSKDKKSLTTLGAGEQSLFNITLLTHLLNGN